MRSILCVMVCGSLLLPVAGCPTTSAGQRNPFVTLAEEFGAPVSGEPQQPGQGGGDQNAGEFFRRDMTVTFANTHVDAELATSMVAWVNVGSIRTADQQDALLRDGYVQLTRETRLGNAFTLPPGTFVYNGAGFAGATLVHLGPTQAATTLAAMREIELITPDVILVFTQPPVSCENVAFSFLRDGEVVFDDDGLITRRTFAEGGFKTLAQVDAYQCFPLRPGLFLKTGGGSREANEYFEGENVTITFNETPDADGNFANVVIAP